MIEKNVQTDFSTRISEPVIGFSTYVHPLAAIIGNVILGKNIMVAPAASVRGDEGQPIYVGDDSNIQDGVVIHALETEIDGKPVEKNLYEVNCKEIRRLCGQPGFAGSPGANSRAGCGYG